jgi:hypothetical protein
VTLFLNTLHSVRLQVACWVKHKVMAPEFVNSDWK